MKKNVMKAVLSMLVLFISLALFVSIAAAADTGMPWEGPLQKILDSIQGPVAKVLGALAIIATGFGFWKADEGSMIKQGLGLCFALSIAFTAVSVFLPLFGFAGGLAF